MNYNKGAMFGLDARIALAIFGALSVISGAALYSAIQQAKITSYITDMTEISKAIESYMLDTGQDLPKISSYATSIPELFSSTVSGWKGPYLSRELNGSIFPALYPDSDVYIDMLDSAETTGGVNYGSSYPCTTSSDYCYYWIRYNAVSEADANAMDLFVDGEVDGTSGNIRTLKVPSNVYFVYLKGPKTLSSK